MAPINPTMSETGIIDLVCNRSVPETVERLETFLESKGIKIFSRIDHAAEARAAGLTMRPTVLLIFGDTKIGTPLMNRHPSIAIDLPTKALIWESMKGKVWLRYNSPEYLQQRQRLDTPSAAAMLALLQTESR